MHGPLSGTRSNPALSTESPVPIGGTRDHPMVIDNDDEDDWWSLPSPETGDDDERSDNGVLTFFLANTANPKADTLGYTIRNCIPSSSTQRGLTPFSVWSLKPPRAADCGFPGL